ncbi:MAG: deaminase [Chloroflexota bacterium]|nr:MAG: deaminase [Chloroflexota bacterium]
MGKVVFANTVSLDGFVAGPNDGLEYPLGIGGERLFHWYGNGDVALPLPGTDMVFHVSQASADLLNAEWNKVGAMIAGRRMFDIAGAWDGHPPGGGPCFIVTHHPPAEWLHDGSPFTFVTDGVASAIRQAHGVAGGKHVALSSASILQQALNAGLVDEIHLDLAPVVLGGGVRLFDHLNVSFELEIIRVVEGKGVTHLTYRVVK